MIHRRSFLALTAAAATLAAPLRVLAQQAQAKRLAFIFTLPKDDPRSPQFAQFFKDGLASQGWTAGRNLIIDEWWGINTPALSLMAGSAALALHPDVIFAVTYVTFASPPMPLPGSADVPIVFALGDPVSSGVIKNVSHPEGNITGFLNKQVEPTGLLAEMLSEVVPQIKRAGYMDDPTSATHGARYALFSAVLKARGIEPVDVSVASVDQIIPKLQEFAMGPPGGLVVESILLATNRTTIVNEVARLRLPAVYGTDAFSDVGGLLTYDLNPFELVRSGGDYVGRILNGAKVADLPIQAPTKYRMVVNLKTAQTLGLSIPASVLARADQVIQ